MMILFVLAGWKIGHYLHVPISSGRLWRPLGGWARRLFWPGRGGQLGLWLCSGLLSLWIYFLLLLFLRILYQLWYSQELLECTAGWRTSLIGCEGKPRGWSAPGAEDKLIMLVTNLPTFWRSSSAPNIEQWKYELETKFWYAQNTKYGKDSSLQGNLQKKMLFLKAT